MEHEVLLPFSTAVVRGALAEPERLARCVPGLQVESVEPPQAAEPGALAALEGRLRLRVAGSTITYRGGATVSETGDGVAVEATGSEARGSGAARLRLTAAARPAPDGAGTTLAFAGTLEATGRIAEVEPKQRRSAGRRLLERIGSALSAELSAAAAVDELAAPDAVAGAGGPVAGGIGAPDDNERAIPGIPAPEGEPVGPPEAVNGTPDADDAEAVAESESESEPESGPDSELRPEPGFRRPGPEIEVPPSALDADAELDEAALDAELDADLDADLDTELDADLGPDDAGEGEGAAERPDREAEAVAGAATPEADVARRTMIGRSAEEVDHAPPRGRYAPEPAPGHGASPSPALRWAAPAAALALASAVVVRQVLRRRR